jgi:hypothetical protein
MKDYIVNVRAIVRAKAVGEKAAANPLGWVIHDTAAEGDLTVIECDTLVEVRAETDKDAVERAKVAANGLSCRSTDLVGYSRHHFGHGRP